MMNRHQHKAHVTGFTLVEMIVVVAIITLISALVLTRTSQFDNATLLKSVAYDVALSIRQAQNYGINVRGQEGNFDNPYGIYFEEQEGTTTYIFFRDLNDDNVYTAGEALDAYKLGRGFSIGRICDFSGTTPSCGGTTQPNVSVVFKRPNPDAIIQNGALSGVGIELLSNRGGSWFISVQSTGQISVGKITE
jgi:prepilin-type N-terminal cleavage/methylation domain-containing protein